MRLIHPLTRSFLAFLCCTGLALAGCARPPAPTPSPQATLAATGASATATAAPSATRTPTATRTPQPRRTPTATPTIRCPAVTPPATPATPGRPVALEVVGQVGGASRAVAVRGELAYLGVGPRLVVVDVSDPAAPHALAQSEVLPGVVQAVALQGERAYVAAGAALVAFDLADPRAPRRLGEQAFASPVRALAVDGERAYVTLGICGEPLCEGSLWIVDVGDGAQMRALGSLEQADYPSAVAAAGDYAYLGTWHGAFQVVDVRDPAAPREVAALRPGGVGEALAMAGQHAYLVGNWLLQVIDIADPAHPRLAGRFEAGSYSSVAVAGGLAYLAGRYCDVGVCFDTRGVVDVRDPANPQAVEASTLAPGADTAAGGGELALAAGRVYRADDRGLEIRDATDPTLPLLGRLDTAGIVESVALWAGHAVAVDGDDTLSTIDVRDPAQPAVVARLRAEPLDTQRRLSLLDLAVADGMACMPAWDDGFWVVDVRDPAHPSEAGRVPIEDSTYRVAVAGGHAYLTGFADDWPLEYGVWVLAVADPAAPQQLAWLALPADNVLSVAVAGSHAYLAGDGRLHVVDVSDPAQPREAGQVALPGGMPTRLGGVAVAGDRAFGAVRSCYYEDCCGGLATFDVSDPARPRFASYLPLAGGVRALAPTGQAVLAATGGSLRAIDVADPATPHQVGACDVPGTFMGVAVEGEYAYLACYDGGLVIVRVGQ